MDCIKREQIWMMLGWCVERIASRRTSGRVVPDEIISGTSGGTEVAPVSIIRYADRPAMNATDSTMRRRHCVVKQECETRVLSYDNTYTTSLVLGCIAPLLIAILRVIVVKIRCALSTDVWKF